MVSRVQERVIQQGLRDPRAIAEGAGPSTSTLLGGACSPPTAHWFLLVGRGRQCVVTSIIRIGMTSRRIPRPDQLAYAGRSTWPWPLGGSGMLTSCGAA